MKTLEELGYMKVEEDQDKIIYKGGGFVIYIDKKKKQVFKSWKVDNYCLATGLRIDELKAVLAILEEKK